METKKNAPPPDFDDVTALSVENRISDMIHHYGSADAALKAVQYIPTPHKYRRAKKLLKKLIRTYKFYFE